MDKPKRLVVDLTPEMKQQLKRLAVNEQTTIKAIVESMIQKRLDQSNENGV